MKSIEERVEDEVRATLKAEFGEAASKLKYLMMTQGSYGNTPFQNISHKTADGRTWGYSMTSLLQELEDVYIERWLDRSVDVKLDQLYAAMKKVAK